MTASEDGRSTESDNNINSNTGLVSPLHGNATKNDTEENCSNEDYIDGKFLEVGCRNLFKDLADNFMRNVETTVHDLVYRETTKLNEEFFNLENLTNRKSD